MSFNVETTIALCLKDRAMYDNVVRPLLDDDQHAAVVAGVAEVAREKSLTALAKSLPDADADAVATIVDTMTDLASLVDTFAPHKSSGTTGGWSGRVVRLATPYGHMKVTITDAK